MLLLTVLLLTAAILSLYPHYRMPPIRVLPDPPGIPSHTHTHSHAVQIYLEQSDFERLGSLVLTILNDLGAYENITASRRAG